MLVWLAMGTITFPTSAMPDRSEAGQAVLSVIFKPSRIILNIAKGGAFRQHRSPGKLGAPRGVLYIGDLIWAWEARKGCGPRRLQWFARGSAYRQLRRP